MRMPRLHLYNDELLTLLNKLESGLTGSTGDVEAMILSHRREVTKAVRFADKAFELSPSNFAVQSLPNFVGIGEGHREVDIRRTVKH